MRLIDVEKIDWNKVESVGGHISLGVTIDDIEQMPTVETIPIDWKLFPETTPRGLESYLVTYLDKENKKQVTVGWLVGNRWYYKHNNVMERIEGVMAFAKLPEPYASDKEEIPIRVKEKEWWED